MDKFARTLAPYVDWLRAEGYQESTIRVTMRHLRAVAASKQISACRVAHVQRYLRYVAETRKNHLSRDVLRLAFKQGFEASADRHRSGARVKEALSPENWTKLRAKLRRGDDISWMLIGYMQSAYRIGQFLKLRSDKVDESDIQDKRVLDWLRARREHVPLYRILCKTERCAYYRMRRRLLDVCESLEVAADFDTLHRTRGEMIRAEEAA